jgi:fumarate reductase subunit C
VSTLPARREALLWLASRASAAVLGLCVLVHLATMIVAVRGGLSATDILARTRGSVTWMLFYGVFVVAAAVHAPLGVRSVLIETTSAQGRIIDTLMLAFGLLLLVLGLRAVLAVTGT